MAPVAYREKVDWKQSEYQAEALSLSWPYPTRNHKAVKWFVLPWRLPKALPHTIHRCLFYNRPCYRESKNLYLKHRNKHMEAAKLRRQKNMAQMKEKTSSKITK